jgi:hypothetical protein
VADAGDGDRVGCPGTEVFCRTWFLFFEKALSVRETTQMEASQQLNLAPGKVEGNGGLALKHLSSKAADERREPRGTLPVTSPTVPQFLPFFPPHLWYKNRKKFRGSE